MKITSEDEEIVRELTDYLSSDESKDLGDRFLEAVKNCLPELARTNIAQAKVYAQLNNPEAAADRMNSARQHLDSFKVYETDPDRRKPLEEYFAAATEFIANQQGKAVDLAILPADESMLPLYPFFQLQIDTDSKYASLTLPEAVERVEAFLANRTTDQATAADSYIEEFFQSAMMRARFFEAADFAPIGQASDAISKAREACGLQCKYPDKIAVINDAVTNELQQKDAINAPLHDTTVMTTPREITVVVQFEYDEDETGIKLDMPRMSEYERQVFNALCSLWLYGHDNHTYTSEMIYRTMTGQGSGGKASSGQKSAITRFMRKWEGMRVTLDFSEEAKKRNLKQLDGKPATPYYKERFIDYAESRDVDGVIKWKLKEAPLLLQYSYIAKHVLFIPFKLFDIKKIDAKGKRTTVSISNTDDRIAIKGYLLRRIAIMKDKKHKKCEWSDTILFDTVFEEIGLATANKDKRSKMYEYATQCLDYWKAERYITNYALCYQGKKIRGIQITL